MCINPSFFINLANVCRNTLHTTFCALGYAKCAIYPRKSCLTNNFLAVALVSLSMCDHRLFLFFAHLKTDVLSWNRSQRPLQICSSPIMLIELCLWREYVRRVFPLCAGTSIRAWCAVL